jgi:hypothetical protein
MSVLRHWNISLSFRKGAALAVLPLLLAACVEKGAPPRDAKPRIEVIGGEVVDWGRTGPGMLKRTVRFYNAGGDTLRIAGVRPSCGCTTAPLDKNVLAPGDTGSISITMDVKTKAGPQKKSILISSNDSTRPNLSIGLMADVVREVVASPDFFPVVNNVKPGEEGTSEIDIINTGDSSVTIQPPTLSGVPSMIVHFDMKKPVTLGAGEKVKVVAHVQPIHEGQSQADVVFRTTSTVNPELPVALTCYAK